MKPGVKCCVGVCRRIFRASSLYRGVYPFKRTEEDPTRMFAGEGGPERTNRRFHYVSKGMPAKRLSTAFDSVTLYGHDPDYRPDIYGKIGNSGVSICCLDDAKKLYSGFNLADPKTSVSMTINGPAAILTGFFMNAAIDQQCELYIRQHGLEQEVEAKIQAIYAATGTARPAYQGPLPEGNDGLGLMLLGVTGDQVLPKEVYDKIKAHTVQVVRGTVQADILKEDQAQNTCIFSTEFSLRLMGDVQQYFIEKKCGIFIPFPYPATTLPKRAPIRSPNWPSRSRMDSPMWSITVRAGWTSTRSRRT